MTKLRVVKSGFIYSVPKLSLLRELGPEIAFIGRSNAGKSSLINALCNNNDLARTSKTPGRTRHAVAYSFTLGAGDNRKDLTLIDLPGFGFALMSKQEAKECETLIFSYLAKREPLKLIVLLLDIRRDLDDREQRIVSMAHERNIDIILVLTKSDKLAVSKRRPVKNKIASQLAIDPQAVLLHSIHDNRTTLMLRKAIFEQV